MCGIRWPRPDKAQAVALRVQRTHRSRAWRPLPAACPAPKLAAGSLGGTIGAPPTCTGGCDAIAVDRRGRRRVCRGGDTRLAEVGRRCTGSVQCGRLYVFAADARDGSGPRRGRRVPLRLPGRAMRDHDDAGDGDDACERRAKLPLGSVGIWIGSAAGRIGSQGQARRGDRWPQPRPRAATPPCGPRHPAPQGDPRRRPHGARGAFAALSRNRHGASRRRWRGSRGPEAYVSRPWRRPTLGFAVRRSRPSRRRAAAPSCGRFRRVPPPTARGAAQAR